MRKSNFSDRLHAVIPGGAHTYSRGDDQYPSNAPQLLVKGKNTSVWDADNNEFLDYGMALRSVTIGYAYDYINQAAFSQINNGVNLTRPSLVELEAAEMLVDLIPSVEMVKFAKNGSNVTTAAVKIARAYTQKKYICIPRQHPFFSFDDWFIGTTPVKIGIPEEHYRYTLLFDFNDIDSLSSLFALYPNQIAGVMLEPATSETPCSAACTESLTEYGCQHCQQTKSSFLHQIQYLCQKNNALFILDEMITGFRWHLQGAQTYFGVTPDLCTFGKGMANGFSVAALAGKKEVMSSGSIYPLGQERTFLMSTTHGAEMPGLGALLATIQFYKDNRVISHLWNYGSKLMHGFNAISNELDLLDTVFMKGPPISIDIVTNDLLGNFSLDFRTLFLQEMVKHHILMPYVSICYLHSDADLSRTLTAVQKALSIYKLALETDISNYLVGHSVKPVFRTYN